MQTVVLAADTVVVLLLALLVVGLLRSHAEILERLDIRPEDGFPEGQRLADDIAAPAERAGAGPAYDIVGVTLGGEARKIGVRAYAGDTLVAFLSSGCLVCEDFWKTLRAGNPPELPSSARVVAVTKDPTEESPAKLQELAGRFSDVVMSSAAWKAYSVPVAPYFVYVDGVSGTVVGEGATRSWAQLKGMLGDAVSDRKVLQSTKWWGRRRGGARRPETPAERDERADLALAAAGIGPEDPSLYPTGPAMPNGKSPEA